MAKKTREAMKRKTRIKGGHEEDREAGEEGRR